MIIKFCYPWSSILNNNNQSRFEFSKLITSGKCINYEKIDKCIIRIFVQRRLTLKGKVRKKKYFTNEELFKIFHKVFTKYYLINTEIIKWDFI